MIKDRVSIHARLDEINKHVDVGDFEGDLILGVLGGGVTLVDRKSLFTLMQATHTVKKRK